MCFHGICQRYRGTGNVNWINGGIIGFIENISVRIARVEAE